MVCALGLLFLGAALPFVAAQYYPIGFVPPPPPPPQGVYVPNSSFDWAHPPNPNNWSGVGLGLGACRQPRDDHHQSAKRNDLFVGCVTQFDRLLYVDRFEKYGRWWTTREKIVSYPSFGRGVRRNETITGIWAFDKTNDDSGSRVAIIRGGAGHKNVTIKFFSEGSGRGFHYLLKIFGH